MGLGNVVPQFVCLPATGEIRNIRGNQRKLRVINEAANAIPWAATPRAARSGSSRASIFLRARSTVPLRVSKPRAKRSSVTVCGFISEPRCGALLKQVVKSLHPLAEPSVVSRELRPVLLRTDDSLPRAGDVQGRQGAISQRLPVGSGVGPRSQGQGERGDLGAAGIDLEAEQVFPEHGIAGVSSRQFFIVHPQWHEQPERGHQEMAGAAAGIEHRELFERPGPAVEGACRRISKSHSRGRLCHKRRSNHSRPRLFTCFFDSCMWHSRKSHSRGRLCHKRRSNHSRPRLFTCFFDSCMWHSRKSHSRGRLCHKRRSNHSRPRLFTCFFDSCMWHSRKSHSRGRLCHKRRSNHSRPRLFTCFFDSCMWHSRPQLCSFCWQVSPFHPGVRVFFRGLDQPLADGVLPDVFDLLLQLFLTSQDVIERLVLPDRPSSFQVFVDGVRRGTFDPTKDFR